MLSAVALHPSPGQLGRTLRCPGQGSRGSPRPSASAAGARARQWVQRLRPYVQINSACSFTSSCSDGSVSGRLRSAERPPGRCSRALAPGGFPAVKLPAPQRPPSRAPSRWLGMGVGPGGSTRFWGILTPRSQARPAEENAFLPFPSVALQKLLQLRTRG